VDDPKAAGNYRELMDELAHVRADRKFRRDEMNERCAVTVNDNPPSGTSAVVARAAGVLRPLPGRRSEY
jgi:hypothetical protein